MLKSFLNFGLMASPILFTFASIGISATTGERPSVIGHTNLSTGHMWGAPHSGDNYGVYSKERVVYIITSLLPVKLQMENGRLMHVTHVMKTGNVLLVRTPATHDEELLWRKYFA